MRLLLLVILIILLLIFLCLLLLLILPTIIALIFTNLNLLSLRGGTGVDFDLGFFFGFPVWVEVGRVIKRVLVNSNDKVVGVKGLVELWGCIDTRFHFLLSVIYERLNLLLGISLAIELILKEPLHLEVRVGACTGITSVTIVRLTVWRTDTILMSRWKGYLRKRKLSNTVCRCINLLSFKYQYFLF